MHVLLPALVQPLPHPLQWRMSLQSFGVSHMKLGGEDELRSLMRAQSVTPPQLPGFASTILEQRLVLLVMSWNATNPLCSWVYGSAPPCDAACCDALTFHVTLPC